ncbi:MAG: bifunctional methylenetetrahydrofolate dehydrogenase/methenyltetrahydrofolate cyclohydrolase FolD [Candidatus Lokiarchaeota archaeon]|nr:bifunctional methylenetetrahydrofolate dehydrogenase/methenyltetrahydrofolate cyclohydrolase FolD [Candidatus Lokiarchaeota archaeon]
MNIDKLLNGKKLAESLNTTLKQEIYELVKKTGIKPKLAAIIVGDDPASEIYIRNKHRVCNEIGIGFESFRLPKNTSKEDVIRVIEKLNEDNSIHGFLIQMPIPPHLKSFISEFVELIDPKKDVDGFHPLNKGYLFDYREELIPCTPQGIIALLEHYKIEIERKNVVIINRSNLVGKPLVFMLLKRNATITVCHSFTKNLFEHTRRADILIVAVGQANFINEEKIKEGAIIIDVGINRVDGKLCGDVNFDSVINKCGAITPSPGGVGPLTVAFLLKNTIKAYKKILKSSNLI